MRTRRLSLGAFAIAVATTTTGLAACGTSSSGGSSSGGVKLSLVAYSTPSDAYKKIIAAYQKTPQGKNITFSQSYGASGDQSRAVTNGLKADVVEFSLAPDMTRLVKAGLVAKTWDSDTYKGFITDSVVSIVTRKGNPKNIRTWADLVRPGIKVITPNPFTSGGARWNVMASYGAQSDLGKDKVAGTAYLTTLFHNVPVQDDSARKSLQTFTGGAGDALISYENDAIFAQQKGAQVDYTTPDQTILIENPAAVTTDSAHPAEAKAFLDFLHTLQAQKIFAENGYRPVVPNSAPGITFPTPSKLFTIKDLGGWTTVTKDFFDPTSSVMAGVERTVGVSTSK